MKRERVSPEDWLTGRQALNHDWIGNHLAPGLAYLVRIADGEILDPESESLFRSEELQSWGGRRSELQHLIDSFIEAMSPARLFDSSPLQRLPPQTTLWLTAVTVSIWSRRHAVTEILSRAQRALLEVDECMVLLSEPVAAGPESQSELAAATLRRAHCAVEQLSAALSALPREVCP